MRLVWEHHPCTAETIREALAPARELKDSTVRTVLRRLEEKGYVRHETSGRTYLYQPAQEQREVAASAVRRIIDRLCGGSVEALLSGLVEAEVVDKAELERLARKIAAKKEQGS